MRINYLVFLMFFFSNFMGADSYHSFRRTVYGVSESRASGEMHGKGLKAVLIVGPQEDNTADSENEMDKIAAYLKSQGVSVHQFYDEKAVWNDIIKSANGANILIYSGHGTTTGDNGTVGGLCLQSIISTREIRESIKLSPNAIVLFQSVCYGAGSTAGDNEDIGIEEAQKRVEAYAQSFFDIGAGCYYANNFTDGVLDFLHDFMAGVPVSECFVKSADFWCDIELNEASNLAKGAQIAIATKDWGGTTTRTTYTNGVKKVEEIPSVKSYSIAYVAKPEFSLADVKQTKP